MTPHAAEAPVTDETVARVAVTEIAALSGVGLPSDGKYGGFVTARRVALVLAVTFLILLGAGLRMAPHSTFYPVTGGYQAYSVYDMRHILYTGHEIRLSEKHSVTSYSSGIYLGTQDILRHKVDASIMLLLGLGPGALPDYYRYGLWSQLLLFPLAVIALYCALRRVQGLPARTLDVLTLLAFSFMGSFNMVSVTPQGEANTATGWAFMATAIYGLIRIPDNPVRGRLLFFIFSALLILLYHTSAVLLACAVATLGLFELFRRRRPEAHSHSAMTMLVVVLFVLSYFMYVSVSFFNLFAKSLERAPSLVSYLLRQQSSAAPRDFALSDLLSRGDPTFFRSMATLAFLVAVPVAVVILMGLRGRLRPVAGDRSARVIFPWLVGLIPFTGALFLWSGFSGVLWKAGEFGSLFSVFALATLFAARLATRARLPFYVLAVACVGLSAYLYYSYERHGASYLIYPEQEAAIWLTAHATPDQAVFTDLRLAGPLIARDHLAVVGVNDYDDPKRVRRELLSIYYGNNPRAAVNALRSIILPPQMRLRYAMFSRRAEDDLPGIKGYDYNFKGAPHGYTSKLLRAPGLSLVYDNGTIRIFEIANSSKGPRHGH